MYKNGTDTDVGMCAASLREIVKDDMEPKVPVACRVTLWGMCYCDCIDNLHSDSAVPTALDAEAHAMPPATRSWMGLPMICRELNNLPVPNTVKTLLTVWPVASAFTNKWGLWTAKELEKSAAIVYIWFALK